MAVGFSAAITLKPFLRYHHPHFPKPIPATLPFSPLRISHHTTFLKTQKLSPFTVSVLTQDPKKSTHMEIEEQEQPSPSPPQVLSPKLAEKLARKESERFTYLVAAVISSFGVTSMAVLAVYYRFAWQMEVKFDPFSYSSCQGFKKGCMFHVIPMLQKITDKRDKCDSVAVFFTIVVCVSLTLLSCMIGDLHVKIIWL